MAETEAKLENTGDGEGRRSNPNPIFSLLSRLHLFHFPPPKPESVVVAEQPIPPVGESEKKPVVARLPKAPDDFPSIKLEAEECEQNTNPIVLWQVYAIGGFYVLRWVLARLRERRTRRRPSDDEPAPADD
ncbi:uncharacterized protein LOC130753342 [Actinidia eriantha]|uniref:uncharacterized protein LOC130753342 n=1 Tax=Actinidia eriantha TaxID=165200 RepID=UPI00258CAAC2|nr:uncharacterized protein LOC130753342 [Actinidia eriantha]